MQDTPVQRPTTASCFATFLLPQVLFVADFAERERIAKVCCLAWNIGLFAEAGDREYHIGKVLDLIVGDADAPSPPGFRQEFRDELHLLVNLKSAPWEEL